MIMDKKLIFSADQAVTSTADSTDILDLNAAGDSVGNELYLNVIVKEAATASGSATVTISVTTDSAVGFGTAPVVLYSTAAIGKATLALGYQAVRVKLPIGLKRYLKLTYTVATGPLTAGKFDAFLTPAVESVGSVLR